MAKKRFILRYVHKLSGTGFTRRYATAKERDDDMRKYVRENKWIDFERWEDKS